MNLNLYWILVLLNVVDTLLTTVIIENGGGEVNPIIDSAISFLGLPYGIIAVKFPLLVLLGYLLYKYDSKLSSNLVRGSLFAVLAVYSAVVTYSFILIQSIS